MWGSRPIRPCAGSTIVTALIGSSLLIAAAGSVLSLVVIGAIVLVSVLYDKWQEKQAERRRQSALQDSMRESAVSGRDQDC